MLLRPAVRLLTPDGETAVWEQATICMTGDSITWAPEPSECVWREELVRLERRLAFIGTHSDARGYSHAGEGGNGTAQLIARLASVPSASLYHLLIGTNDGCTDVAGATATAAAVCSILDSLLARPGCAGVLVGTLLPDPVNAAHDAGNTLVNGILAVDVPARPLATLVDYNAAVRAVPGWAALFDGLHPRPAIQSVMAAATAAALAGMTLPLQPVPLRRPAVRIANLFDPAAGETAPLIAGWYQVSFQVLTKGSGMAWVVADVAAGGLGQVITVLGAGVRVTYELMTGFEGYGYTRDAWTLTPHNCTIGSVLVEKKRPRESASSLVANNYLDETGPFSAGELIEGLA